MIPYGRQHIDEDDIAAVVATLRGDWLTQGPAIAAFEAALAAQVQSRHAIAFANGTAALHGACSAAGLTTGHRVATSSLSFVASANCARYVGADVEFVDIDPATLNLDPNLLPESLDALVAVHYAGLPVDLRGLKNRPRVIIEDAAHALGSATSDGPVGNCAHSDMTCFSFHPVKPVTTGEGGVVTTNDDELADRLRIFRSHGITRPPSDDGWYYEVSEHGFNYRLTDIQAALGTSQLRKLDQFVGRRNDIARRYDEAFAGLPIVTPPRGPTDGAHGYHLYAIRVGDRRSLYDHMRANDVAVQVHYVPIHHHPLFRSAVAPALPNTDAAYQGLLSLPMFPALTDDEQQLVIDLVTAWVRRST